MEMLSIITSIAFFLPLILLGIRRLMRDKLLIWFAVFWAWAGVMNIIFGGEEVRNSIKKVVLPFFAIETVAIAVAGFQSTVESILVAVGVLLALYYLGWIILLHMKGTHYSNYQHAMQFIYYALFFEYGVSIINFIYSYLLPDKVSERDNFLIFYMASCITMLIALYGILTYREKIPPGQKKVKKPEREMEIRFL